MTNDGRWPRYWCSIYSVIDSVSQLVIVDCDDRGSLTSLTWYEPDWWREWPVYRMAIIVTDDYSNVTNYTAKCQRLVIVLSHWLVTAVVATPILLCEEADQCDTYSYCGRWLLLCVVLTDSWILLTIGRWTVLRDDDVYSITFNCW